MFIMWKFKIFNSLLISSMLTVAIILDKLDFSSSDTIINLSTQTNQIEFKRTPKFFKENCTCSVQWQCECCAKVNNDLLNVHQKLCADWTIFSDSWNIQANVRLNENLLYTNTFSAWNIPPFCVPIWPAIALTGCIQMHSVAQHEFNTLHGCTNLTLNLITFNLVNFQMACMDVGVGGIQFVEPNHPVVSTSSTEKPPEIELETNEFVKLTTTPIKNREPHENVIIRSSTIQQNSLDYLRSKIFKIKRSL